jgi:hypothetical protein
MYDWSLRGHRAEKHGMQTIASECFAGHIAHSRTSTLAKLLAWMHEQPLHPNEGLAIS